MYKLHLEKIEESEIKLPTFTGLQKKQENSRKTSIFFIDYTKAINCVNHSKLWKILQEMGIRSDQISGSVVSDSLQPRGL